MMRIFIILLLFFFGFSQVGLAQSGIYIVSESGWATQRKLPIAKNVQAQSAEQSHAPILRFGLGYLHDFNDKIGLGFEVGGGWYRGLKYRLSSNKEINAYSKTLEFLAVFLLRQKPLDFFIKIGGIRHTLTNFSVLTNNIDASETRIQPEITAGINYNFGEHFAITSEYLHSFGSNIENFSAHKLECCPSINAILVGIKVTFW
jgi:hypothetical protein